MNPRVYEKSFGESWSYANVLGAPYRVLSRQEWVDRDAAPRTVLRRQQTSDANALALLNEVYTAETAV